mmetsp:Transcript_34394/g.74266  ORF Transcript_34394/g.74266 Transcript_34394/m.74266 type:complete len:97 (+) Transcript_34394:59-349(+)
MALSSVELSIVPSPTLPLEMSSASCVAMLSLPSVEMNSAARANAVSGANLGSDRVHIPPQRGDRVGRRQRVSRHNACDVRGGVCSHVMSWCDGVCV